MEPTASIGIAGLELEFTLCL